MEEEEEEGEEKQEGGYSVDCRFFLFFLELRAQFGLPTFGPLHWNKQTEKGMEKNKEGDGMV